MKRIFLIAFIIFTVILTACGADKNKEEETKPVPTISEEEKLADDQIVAVVNGEEINGLTYNLVYTQLKLYAEQFGQDVTNDEIKDLTVESLIDRQILFQQAEKDGIVFTEQYIKDEIAKIKNENEQTLLTVLEQFQITESAFEHQLKFELTMNEFLAQEIKVTVTEDEIKEYYEKAKEENEDMPLLVEIRDTLKSRIEREKVQEALQDRIDEIKEKAEIEILI